MSNFRDELIAKLEQAKVLDTERNPKRVHRTKAKAPRTPRKLTKQWYRRVCTLTPSQLITRRLTGIRKQAKTGEQFRHLERACRMKVKKYLARNNEAKAKAWSFHITKDQWFILWMNAGVVEHNGMRKLAVAARGRDLRTDVQLMRIYPDKPWTIDNVLVRYLGQVIADGRHIPLIPENIPSV